MYICCFVDRLVCTEMPSCWQLLSHVREATLPFLRCAALFYHHLTGVVAPISLHGMLGVSLQCQHRSDFSQRICLIWPVSMWLDLHSMIICGRFYFHVTRPSFHDSAFIPWLYVDGFMTLVCSVWAVFPYYLAFIPWLYMNGFMTLVTVWDYQPVR